MFTFLYFEQALALDGYIYTINEKNNLHIFSCYHLHSVPACKRAGQVHV
jgi:hypothetical protein